MRVAKTNDFTIEELLIILLDMCTYVEQNKILKESPSHRELRLKVQSMIDSWYKRHEDILIRTDNPKKVLDWLSRNE